MAAGTTDLSIGMLSLTAELRNASRRSGVNVAIETAKEAVHELRGKAQEVAGETVRSVQRTWEQKQSWMDGYMEAHP